MWSALTSYLNDTAPDLPPSTPNRRAALPGSPRAPRAPRSPSGAAAPSPERKRPRDAPPARAPDAFGTVGAADGPAREAPMLRGVVAGRSRSGKTSLLRRLRGEGLGGGGEGEARRLMALIPWKAAGAAAAASGAEGGGSIQLYLSEAEPFSRGPSVDGGGGGECEAGFRDEWREILRRASRNKKSVDFVVWMIDPAENPREVADWVRAGLDALFPGPERRRGAAPPASDLCMLLNFRDLRRGGEGASLLRRLRRVADAALARHRGTAPADAEPDRAAAAATTGPSILVYESSMLTDYGIQNLHSFIALPYLMHKEREYARLVRLARRSYESVKKDLLRGSEEGNDGYEQFVKGLEQSGRKNAGRVVASPNSTPMQEARSERRTASDSGKKRSNNDESERASRPSVEDDAEESLPEKTATHRRLFPPPSTETASSFPETTPLDAARDSLDSFFSDDDSDADDSDRRSRRRRGRARADGDPGDSDGDGGEDSDDDFFIDDAGRRRAHASAEAAEPTALAEGGDESAADRGKAAEGKEDDERSARGSEGKDAPEESPNAAVEADEESELDYELENDLASSDGERVVAEGQSVDGEGEKRSGTEAPRRAPEIESVEADSTGDAGIDAKGEAETAADKVSDVDNEESVFRPNDPEKSSDASMDQCDFASRSADANDEAEARECDPSPDHEIDTPGEAACQDPSTAVEDGGVESIGSVVARQCNGATQSAMVLDSDDESDVPESRVKDEGGGPGEAKGANRSSAVLDSDDESADAPGGMVKDSASTPNKINPSIAVMDSDDELVNEPMDQTEVESSMLNGGASINGNTNSNAMLNRTGQSQMLMDSDDEDSTTGQKDKSKSKTYCSYDHEAIDTTQRQKSVKEMPASSTKMPESKSEVKATSTVSSAALAAIEAARLEAEQALIGEAKPKKEKKSKKDSKKSGKSKKSKKKDVKL